MGPLCPHYATSFPSWADSEGNFLLGKSSQSLEENSSQLDKKETRRVKKKKKVMAPSTVFHESI